jgi:hypothetical protein
MSYILNLVVFGVLIGVLKPHPGFKVIWFAARMMQVKGLVYRLVESLNRLTV